MSSPLLVMDSEEGRYEGGREGGQGSLSLRAVEPSVLLEVSFFIREEEEEEEEGEGGREGGRGRDEEEEGGVFSPSFVASLPFPLGGGEGGGVEGGREGGREGGLERRMAEGAMSLERWVEGREGGWEGGGAYIHEWKEEEEEEEEEEGEQEASMTAATGARREVSVCTVKGVDNRLLSPFFLLNSRCPSSFPPSLPPIRNRTIIISRRRRRGRKRRRSRTPPPSSWPLTPPVA